MRRAPWLLIALVLFCAAACGGDDSPATTPQPRDIPECDSQFTPPNGSISGEPEVGELFSFDAQAVCSGSIGNVTDVVTGAYVQVVVGRVSSGDGIALGDELAVWTTLSLTGAPGQRLLEGAYFHFEAEWKKLDCFGECFGMVGHDVTPLIVDPL